MNKRILYALILLLPVILSGTLGPSQKIETYNEIIPGTELSIEMVAVPAGSFTMGSPESETGRGEDEGPQHNVELESFWMSSKEITWDLYEVFLYRKTDGVAHPDPGYIEVDVDGVSGATMPYVSFNKPGHPVVNVTQYAASVFCEWLTARTGRFYRLPTEAEWEYACRAGSRGPYSFDNVDQAGDYAWYSENSDQMIKPGGEKKPNAWGLYDMHGNAAEWVLDYYEADAYGGHSEGAKNPIVQQDELYPHVVRGGSWKDDLSGLRSASRAKSDPSWKIRDPQFPKSLWWHTDALHVGFRIVRPAKAPPREEWAKYRIKPIKDY